MQRELSFKSPRIGYSGRLAPLHLRPPISPERLLAANRFAVPAIVGVIVFLGLGAAWQSGALLRTWDVPFQRAVEGARTQWLTDAMHAITSLGGHVAVVAGMLILVALVRRRCHVLAWAIVIATLARPVLEFTLKALADRPRPDLERLVPGNGPSFPSGHVLAAIALYGLLPPVVALLTRKRWLWWTSMVASGSVILLIAASRTYLGVHWLSDIVGGLLVGALYLLAVERFVHWYHRRRPCDHCTAERVAEAGAIEPARAAA
jgi:undecaprenyl-diphosphatase